MGESIVQFEEKLSPKLRPIFQEIRRALKDLEPVLEELTKYGIGSPFFNYKGKTVCYVNVRKGKSFVEVGFVKGFKLSDAHHRLVTENRTIVRALQFEEFSETDKQILMETVFEAMALRDGGE